MVFTDVTRRLCSMLVHTLWGPSANMCLLPTINTCASLFSVFECADRPWVDIVPCLAVASMLATKLAYEYLFFLHMEDGEELGLIL